MRQDNDKKPENIGCVLYLRDQFSSDLQNKEPPESVIPETERFDKRRIGHRFIPDEITYPTVDDSVFLELANKNASEEEVKETAGKYFDSKNEHLLEKSKGGIDALRQHENHLSHRQAHLEELIEETPSIRTLYSDTNLVEPPKSQKLSALISRVVILLLFLIEWGNLGTSVQMSGEEVFLGSGGFFKALLVTTVPVIFTWLLKTWFPGLGWKSQKIFGNIVVGILSILVMVYFFGFANYYGWQMDDTSLAMPPDIYKKVMLYAQLSIPPFAIALIISKYVKQANEFKEEFVFHNKEFLALDEELTSVVARRKDTGQILKHLEGFGKLYLAKKLSLKKILMANILSSKLVI